MALATVGLLSGHSTASTISSRSLGPVIDAVFLMGPTGTVRFLSRTVPLNGLQKNSGRQKQEI